jgi:hypothetical protein
MSRSRVVGRRVSTSVSQASGSWPLAFAVASRLMMAAARLPAVSEPANNQFLRLCGAPHNRNYAKHSIMQSSPLLMAA